MIVTVLACLNPIWCPLLLCVSQYVIFSVHLCLYRLPNVCPVARGAGDVADIFGFVTDLRFGVLNMLPILKISLTQKTLHMHLLPLIFSSQYCLSLIHI